MLRQHSKKQRLSKGVRLNRVADSLVIQYDEAGGSESAFWISIPMLGEVRVRVASPPETTPFQNSSTQSATLNLESIHKNCGTQANHSINTEISTPFRF